MADPATILAVALGFIVCTVLFAVTQLEGTLKRMLNAMNDQYAADRAADRKEKLTRREVKRIYKEGRRAEKTREKEEERAEKTEEKEEERAKKTLRREEKRIATFGDYGAWSGGMALHKNCKPVEYMWNDVGAVYPAFMHPNHPDTKVALNEVQLVPTLQDEKDELGKLCIHRLPYEKVELRPNSTRKEGEKSTVKDGHAFLFMNEDGYLVFD